MRRPLRGANTHTILEYTSPEPEERRRLSSLTPEGWHIDFRAINNLDLTLCMELYRKHHVKRIENENTIMSYQRTVPFHLAAHSVVRALVLCRLGRRRGGNTASS